MFGVIYCHFQTSATPIFLFCAMFKQQIHLGHFVDSWVCQSKKEVFQGILLFWGTEIDHAINQLKAALKSSAERISYAPMRSKRLHVAEHIKDVQQCTKIFTNKTN